jgi:hypothetical protein
MRNWLCTKGASRCGLTHKWCLPLVGFYVTDLRPGDIEQWYLLRDELGVPADARSVQTRFCRDPSAYLVGLEYKLLLLKLQP